MKSSHTSILFIMVIGLLANACSWTTSSLPSPQQKKTEIIPVTESLALAITPQGDIMDSAWKPESLNWSRTCRNHAQKLDPCLVAWVDNEIKVKRPNPMGMEIGGNKLASYFWIRHEDGEIMHPEKMLTNMDLLDRRLWIEQQDMRMMVDNRIPHHALPLGELGGIVPGNGLPNPLIRIGLSYKLECVQKRGKMNFPLGELRESARTARIVGRFVAVNPSQETLRDMKRVTKDMAKDTSSPWQQMKLDWHKPSGSMNWISDELVMLSTKDWLTFRRPTSDYSKGEVDFKNKSQEMPFMGEWLLKNNVAPSHMQGIFPRMPEGKPGRVFFTIPTIRPRLDEMSGAIFVPLAVEVIVGITHPRFGGQMMPIGCIPFEQEGINGNLTMQLLRPMLEAAQES
jgi:hypothetical protein